jgi:hypothetical protein
VIVLFVDIFSYIVLCSTISGKGGHLRIFTCKNYPTVNLPPLSFMNCPIPHSVPSEHKRRIVDNHCLNFLFVIVELTYSRTPVKAFCTSLSGCKCNTAKCYFGDPCLCSDGTEFHHFCSFKDKCFLLFFSYIVLCSTISGKGGHLRIFTCKNYPTVNLPPLSNHNA